eukprot:Clim_evm26s151 gene=Clim_evmTU26s151
MSATGTVVETLSATPRKNHLTVSSRTHRRTGTWDRRRIQENFLKSKHSIEDHVEAAYQEDFEEAPLGVIVMTYLGYAVLIALGHLTDLLTALGLRKSRRPKEVGHEGFVPLYADFESFFTRHLYRRIRDVFNRPISSVPGRHIELVDRETTDFGWTFRETGTRTKVLNLGSYNYLGFGENHGKCTDDVETAIRKYGISTAAPRADDSGSLSVHEEVERVTAKYLGCEDAIVTGMGFATNSTTIPALVSKGSLIISDANNHASVVLGARLSGATIKTYRHNDMCELERILRESIVNGQPRTHRPWKKILVIVEGIYSMEGSIVRLRDIIELKKKYKFYVYLDEAHSIGALGHTGRGVTEYWGVDPKDVDIMMGTFTKSFGASGGYIAGPKRLIQSLRNTTHAYVYATSMAPAVCQQIISSLTIIAGWDNTDEGQKRLMQLKKNVKQFRTGLRNLGFIVYGNDDSPIVPAMIYHPAKIAATSRLLLEEGLGVVVVGFPATPIISSRIRFCLSAAHTDDDIISILEKMDRIGDALRLKYSTKHKI